MLSIVMCFNVFIKLDLHLLQEIAQAAELCRLNPTLQVSHGPQLHTLLGLYAMTMNCLEEAEMQFTVAIQVNNINLISYLLKLYAHFIDCCLLQTSQERELWTFANLNLAIVYLRGKRDSRLSSILDSINPDNLPSHSHSLKAAAFYVQGLQAFFQAKYNDAK